MSGPWQLGNTPVYYFPPGLRFEAVVEIQGLGDRGLLYDDSPLLDSDIARRIVLAGARLRFPAALYWPDGRDLTAVDALVAEGAVPEVSMEGAVVCNHRQVHPDARDVRSQTGCPHRFMGLVWEHTSLPVPGIDRRYRPADAFIDACPKCSLKLMPGVLEILTETTPARPQAGSGPIGYQEEQRYQRGASAGVALGDQASDAAKRQVRHWAGGSPTGLSLHLTKAACSGDSPGSHSPMGSSQPKYL